MTVYVAWGEGTELKVFVVREGDREIDIRKQAENYLTSCGFECVDCGPYQWDVCWSDWENPFSKLTAHIERREVEG